MSELCDKYAEDVQGLLAQIDELEDENARLAAVVERLRKSRDGHPFFEGDTMYVLDMDEGVIRGKVVSDSFGRLSVKAFDLDGCSCACIPEEAYSTREAAEAAAINAKIDEAVKAMDAQWERAVKSWMVSDKNDALEAIRQRLYAEVGPTPISRIFGKWPGDETGEQVQAALDELEESDRPSYAEARQRLRDAGADRWDHQTLDPITEHDAGDEHR